MAVDWNTVNEGVMQLSHTDKTELTRASYISELINGYTHEGQLELMYLMLRGYIINANKTPNEAASAFKVMDFVGKQFNRNWRI